MSANSDSPAPPPRMPMNLLNAIKKKDNEPSVTIPSPPPPKKSDTPPPPPRGRSATETGPTTTSSPSPPPPNVVKGRWDESSCEITIFSYKTQATKQSKRTKGKTPKPPISIIPGTII